ncbi:MAG: type II CRISPR-associated endonuclease Cas1 [Eggerthellales bacterium]|nr:type II CRISPR-associated endonuclease Cas1 [Eggerthellales bacterium]
MSIEYPSELHVASGQLSVDQEDTHVSIPLSDIAMLVLFGPSIRISSMALDLLASNKTLVLLIGSNHLPSSMVIPMVSNARQAKIAKTQVFISKELRSLIWQKIIRQKIENQARALAIAGLPGSTDVVRFVDQVFPDDVGNAEGAAARLYFQYLHPGLNRRSDDPFNSALNYGYAIVRALVARSLVTTGFIPSFGIHHQSQLNAFNLADDFIEPFRPMVDLIALQVVNGSQKLSRDQRAFLRRVAYQVVMMEGKAVALHAAVDAVADSFRSALDLGTPQLLKLPTICPVGFIDPVRE